MRFLYSSIPVIIAIMLLRDGMAATTSQQTDYDDRDQCDESKCAGSQGISADGSVFHYASAFNGSFNCYSGVTKYEELFFPPMCVDGYIPHIIEKDLNLTLDYDDIDEDDIDLLLDQYPVDVAEYWHYYTCCPPSVLSSSSKTKTKNIIRHCSDPIIKTNNSSTMDMDCSSNNDQRYHMRPMKNNSNKIMGGRIWVESFVCCDTPAIDDQNFLNETECVPYINEYYRTGRTLYNKYGLLTPIRCKTSNTDFQYPKANKEEPIYGCCKTVDEDTKLFYEDTAFYGTLYPQIVLSSFAVIACTILIVALMVPLVDYLRQQSSMRSAHPSTVITTNATSSASTCNYSSYNLYLLYLALPDLILNVYILAMYCSYANQIDNHNFNGLIISDEYTDAGSVFEISIIVSASTANLFLNCVVSYEIMLLLKNNNRVVRHQPPSLLKVTSQASAVYIFSIVVFTVTFIMAKAALKQMVDTNEFIVGKKIFLALRITLNLVTYALPIGFFVSIWIIIQVRGYLPSLTGREKELVRYFFFHCYTFLPSTDNVSLTRLFLYTVDSILFTHCIR